MTNKIIFLLFFVFFKLSGQHSVIYSSEKKAVIDFRLPQQDFYTAIQCIEKPVPGGFPQKAETESEKKKFGGFTKTNSSLNPPSVGKNFFANPFYNSTPNDNDIAVSNDCKIVSVSNTLIYFYDCLTDSSLGTQSLSAFASALGLANDEFDPIVEYDPVDDRFILVCLNGFTDSTSSIILGFSQSNDPKAGWNLYNIPGNPKNNGLWTDYPMMSVSPKELFITVNLLYPDSSWQTGFVETLIWQIKKEDGYAGNTLSMAMHDSIFWNGKPVRNLCPARGGSGPYGPNQFFVSNRNFANNCDTVFLVQITDTIGAPNQQVLVSQLNTDVSYSFPPDARQFATHKMATNDARNLGAFYENDKIQYVHNTLDTTTGFCAIYHGVIDQVSGSAMVHGNILGDSVCDLGYPNLSYIGTSSSDNSSIINANHTAPNINAGCSVFKSDGNGQYSSRVTVKNGTSYVNVLNGALERWGDYSGSQRKYNEPGKIWMSGYYGYLQSSSRRHGTWIAEIGLTPFDVGFSETLPQNEFSLFPNPVNDFIQVKFELKKNEYLNFIVFDATGKMVKVLMRENIKAGLHQFSFSTQPLTSGTYFLRISNTEDTIFSSEKFIKSE